MRHLDVFRLFVFTNKTRTLYWNTIQKIIFSAPPSHVLNLRYLTSNVRVLIISTHNSTTLSAGKHTVWADRQINHLAHYRYMCLSTNRTTLEPNRYEKTKFKYCPLGPLQSVNKIARYPVKSWINLSFSLFQMLLLILKLQNNIPSSLLKT